jgi:type VI secretion system protein ImpF
MAGNQRVNATLFDKLAGGLDLDGLVGDGSGGVSSREAMRFYALPNINRFNEEALRVTVRRELAWLLNTTQLGAVEDLTAYPHVKTSVLNYGVPDLAGKSATRTVVVQRARDIRAAIRAFEPRIDEKSLVVEPVESETENSVTYLIHGDVRSAVSALPVKFRTDVESDTAAVTVRD